MDPFKLGTLALILCVPGSLIAQGMAIPTARLESPVDSVRMNAFYALQAAAYDGRRHPDKPQTTFLADSARVQPALAATLIKLLEFENALVAAAPAGSLSQDYLEDYYTTLQITVARMRDPASAAALMPGITLAIEALASFGDVSFPGVMAVLQGTDEHKHFAAVITLGVMIAGRAQNHLSDASTERAVQALLKEAQDSTSAGREEAIKGFLSVNNPEIRPVMERLAASDTTASLHAPGRPVRYGVRDAARAWLAAHPNPAPRS